MSTTTTAATTRTHNVSVHATPRSAPLSSWTEYAVELHGLTKHYGQRPVLRGVDLTVPTGTTLALLGPNGAGKTTTCEILQGLRRRRGGTARVLGEDPQTAGPAWRARIGVVAQSSADLAELTVEEAVTWASRFYARPAPVAQTIARVGLGDDASTRAGRLSGGRRRRLDIALAIIGRPELLFLDEPTTGFDPQARRDFWSLIASLKAQGTSVLLTTHYLEEAAALADDIAILLDGRVVERGTPAQLAADAGELTTVSWRQGGSTRNLRTATPTAVVSELTARLAGPDGEVPGLQVRVPTLEDHYLGLLERHENSRRDV